ncbi:MAG: GatB/YqeY domain-containing protein [Alphaproteobacteria bacterium]|nr:GatB/YqeY domain-containing protein [Alphaproteobacteria bacterium]
MEKREEFNTKLKEAMKSKSKIAVSTIRLILAALKDRDISARSKGKADGIEDSEILSMLQSMIKQRREASKIYIDAGREELAEQEDSEIKVIEEFLPQQLNIEQITEEVQKIIKEIGANEIKDMGKIMAILKSRFTGEIDMSKAGGIVKEYFKL